MNLRVLIYPNPLVVDKVSKRFLYWKDSGFLFTKNLIGAMPDDWRYYWLVPESVSRDSWFYIKGKHIKLVPYPFSTSIHQNRYEFYGEALKREFPYTKDIDAVINHQPEVTANIKSWLDNQRRDASPIFNFFHWIDCKESRSFSQALGGYFWREYDGVLSSERTYFHNPYAKSLFDGMVAENIKNPESYNHGFFNPPASFEAEKGFGLPDRKIILFNHRLNNTTNWRFFLESIDALHEKRDDFVVWFTDNSDKAKSKLLERPYVINKSLPDAEYGFLLANSHFSVCTHKGYSTWNMAVIDAINKGCFTIVPRDEVVYKYMFGYVDRGMYHDNSIDIVDTMSSLLDVDKEALKSRAMIIKGSFPDYFSPDCLSVISRDIEEAVLAKTKNQFPAKYDEVRDFVQQNGIVKKEEFVNKFWSFHANSNFQTIRWKLLQDGISDDVSKDVPTYHAGIISPSVESNGAPQQVSLF